MDFQDCIEFANAHPACFLATTEGDQPRVRGLLMWFADDTGFYFQTQSVKAVAKQLKNNKKVEVMFMLPEPEKYHSPEGRKVKNVMRVSGEVKIIEDMAIRAKCIEERTFLKEFDIVKPEDPLLFVFQIYTGEAYFWSGEYTMRESEIERIKF